jgi:hypothetical protein
MDIPVPRGHRGHELVGFLGNFLAALASLQGHLLMKGLLKGVGRGAREILR